MSGILAHVRVLDFGRYVAGPVCAALLGDLGAEVIRVERVDGGEDRSITPLSHITSGGRDGGALYLGANRNKLGLTLNPIKPEGREVLRRLLATADVVVANLPDRALRTMGLDAASVHGVKPDIVLATVDAFGAGPWGDRLGFDGIGQVMSGSAHLTGDADRPGRAAALWVDYNTATLAALGVLAGLLQRERTGAGEHVQANLLHTALHVMSGSISEESVTAPGRVGSGNRGQTVGPTDIVQTTDGWVIVQVVGDPMFSRWARMIDRTDLLEDPRFDDDALRGDNRDVLCQIAADWCATRSTDEVLEAFDAAGLATAPVLSPADALQHPHIAAAGMLEAVPYPGAAADPVIATAPLTVASTGRPAPSRAPLLGEHTQQILAELGFTAAEIASLRAGRVV